MLKAVLQAIPTYSMSCFQLPVSLCKRIQSALTRFWWDSEPDKKKIAWVSWERLTLPKAEGGLGLKDIQLFNQALLAKLAWRILTKPSCLLARVLKGKYCQKQSFLDTLPSPASSHGWHGILLGKNLLKENISRTIGNGRTIRIWKDPWISTSTPIKPFGPNRIDDYDIRVSDLLTDDLKKWNVSRIRELLPQLEPNILCLQPSHTGMEDSYCWHHLNSGTYTSRSGYHTLALQTKKQILQPRSNVPLAFNWLKYVWQVKISPKLQLFIWQALQGALPVGDNLSRRGIAADLRCRRCGEQESLIHLFFACLPPTGVSEPLFPWLCWSIWTSRNRLIFEAKASSPSDIINHAIGAAREWIQAQSAPQVKTLTFHPPLESSNRSYAPPCTEITTDAAWNQNSKTAGLAWVIRDQTTATTTQGTQISYFVSSPLIAEALAVRAAIYNALELQLPSIHLKSDSQTLIRAIEKDLCFKDLFGILADIKLLSSRFSYSRFSFIPRSSNVCADRLAKSTLLNAPLVGLSVTPNIGL